MKTPRSVSAPRSAFGRLALAVVVALSSSCGAGRDAAEAPREKAPVGSLAQQITATPPNVTPLTLQTSNAVGGVPGGGAVASNGAYTYTIPITVPAGRAGMQPKLALQYSSHGGNGRLGVGWSISGLSMISRCARHFASGQGITGRGFRRQTESIQFDNLDDFCLDGEKLILQSGTHAAANAEYRTEHETFQRIRITSVGPLGPSDWTVWRKDGTTAIYRQHTAFFRDTLRPDGSLDTRQQQILMYPLAQEEDRGKNRIQYTWGPEPEPRILEIRYTSCSQAGACAPYGDTWKRRVQFVYDPDPNPPPSRYVNGFLISSAFLLRFVNTWDHTSVTDGALVRSYWLNYVTSAISGRNLLGSVRVIDGGPNGGTMLRATNFQWEGQSVGTPDQEYLWRQGVTGGYTDPLVQRSPLIGRLLPETLLESTFAVLDANGDGNDDLVVKRWAGATNGLIIGADGRKTSTVEPRDLLFLGIGNGQFEAPVPLDPEGNGQPAAGATCQQAEIVSLADAIPVDLDQNGRTELVAQMSTTCPFETLPSCTNAPGQCDFRITSRYWPINNPPEGPRKYAVLRWDPALGTLRSQSIPLIDGVSWVRDRVLFADVNGNGLPDLFRTDFTISRWREWSAGITSVSNPVAVDYVGSTDTFLHCIPLGTAKPDDVHTIVDEDGDGRQELLNGQVGVYRAYSRNRDLAREWRVVNEANGTTSTTTESATVTQPDQQFLNPQGGTLEPAQRVYLDLNGDGLLDFIVPVPATGEFLVRVNTGAGFTAGTRLSTDQLVIDALRPYAVAGDEAGRAARSGLRTADWNGDGRDDLILLGSTVGGTSITLPGGADSFMYTKGDAIQVILARPNGFAPPFALPTNSLQRFYNTMTGWTSIKLAELDGNFLPEIVAFVREGTTGSQRRLMTLGRRERWRGVDVISVVDDSRGNQAEVITYDSMSAGSSRRLESADTHTSDTYGTEFEPGTNPPVALHLPCAYPGKCVARGTVVRTFEDNRSSSAVSQNFRYAGARLDITGRGSLGFRKVTVRDSITGEVTESRYWPVISQGDLSPASADYHAYPRLAQPFSVKRKIPFNAVRTVGIAAPADAPVATKVEWVPQFSTGRPISTRSLTTRVRVSEETGTLGSPPPASQETERVRHEVVVNYDTLGNEESRTSSTFDVSLTGTTEKLVERVTTTTTYQNNSTNWLISLPNRRTVRYETLAAPYGTCSTFPCDAKTTIVDHVFDSRGFLTDVVREPTGDAATKLTMTFGRDAAGMVRSVLHKDGTASSATTQRLTEIDYDAFGHHERVTRNAEGHLNWFLYDQRVDQLMVETDPNGVSTYAQYDYFGRLVTLIDDRGPMKTISYGDDVVRETDVSGGRRSTFYDVRGRPELLVWTTLAGAGASQKTYDALGNVIETRYRGTTESYDTVSQTASAARQRATAAGSIVTGTSSYDARDRQVSSRSGGDSPVLTSYKRFGENWVEQGSGAALQQRRTFLSAAGRVREARDRLVVGSAAERFLTTTYAYEALGLLARVADPKNQVTTLFYDRLGRKTSQSSPALKSAASTWQYSAFGDVTRVTDGVNDVSSVYDRLGRIDRKNLTSGGALVADFTWDQGSAALGKLSRAVGPTGHDISFTYDVRGRPAGEVHVLGQARLSTLRTYDGVGRIDTLQYPETATTDNPLRTRSIGLKIRYFYTNGQTSRLDDVTGATPVTLWTVTERHALGMLQKATEGARTATWTYKPETMRLESVNVAGMPGSDPGPGLAYAYGTTGLLTSRTTGGVVETFDYDTLRRLWRYQRIRSAGNPLRLASGDYSYDDAGNITRLDTTQSQQSPDWPLIDVDYVYNAAFPQRLSRQNRSGAQREYRYDAAGRQTEYQPDIQVTAFRKTTYNHEDLPTRVEQMLNATTPDTTQAATTFDYDAFGRRVQKARGTAVLLYMNGLYVRRPEGSTYLIDTEDGQVAQLTRSTTGGLVTTSFAYKDNLGSRVALTTPVGTLFSGAFPYGQPWHEGTAPSGTFAVGLTGHMEDNDLGLVNMQGRIYDPNQGRFITPDPKSFPGAAGGMNPYSYVLNSPVNYSDPSGFEMPGLSDWGDYARAQRAAAAAAEARANGARKLAEAAAEVGARTAGTRSAGAAAEVAARSAEQQASQESLDAFNGKMADAIASTSTVEFLTRARDALAGVLIDRDRLDANRQSMAELPGGPPSPPVLFFSDFSTSVLLTGPPVADLIFGVFIGSAKPGLPLNPFKVAPSRTVFGHHPLYMQRAAQIGARRLHMTPQIWDKLNDEQRWAIHTAFIDRVIAEGHEIVLSTPAAQARSGSWFARELQYLDKKGFTPTPDGMRMVPKPAP